MKDIRLSVCMGILSTLASAPVYATTGPAQTAIVASANNAVNGNLNPAGLTRIQSPEWVGQVLYFNSTSDYEYSSDVRPGLLKDSEGGSTTIPFVYYARPLTDRLGFGVFVTGNSFGADLDDSGPSSYLVKDWNLTTGSLQGNLGYRLTDKLSIGGGISLNYTFFELKSNVLNLEPGAGDGEMKLDDSDITASFTLGTLYELTEQTRVGLTYRSKIDPSISDTPSFSNIGPGRQALFDAGLGVFNRNVGLDFRIPQLALAGVYHEFDSGDAWSLDGGWVDFSDFGITELSLGDATLNRQSQEFNDLWLGSTGYFHQLNEKWQLSVGGLYMSSALSDSNRTYGFKMDRIWGVGFGTEYKWKKNLIFGLNLNYYDLGDGKIQTLVEQTGETLSGKYTDHYAIGIDFTVRWIR